MTTWWCEHAWVNRQAAQGVRVHTHNGVITDVTINQQPQPGDHHLHGMVFPGFANAHSHAFHRALRGQTHGNGGTFWTWRDVMYRVAHRLTPDRYYALARAAYAEMALAGMTCVGEFHYVHHTPNGTPYTDPHAMNNALRAAAEDAGLRITLLDTCYITGGLTPTGHTPLNDGQARFGHPHATAWAERATATTATTADPRPTPGGYRPGAAIHSVRAVPANQLHHITAAFPDGPIHVHVSEQPAEIDACRAHYGKTPPELLADAGISGPNVTYVHATHLTDNDITIMGQTSTTACFCPTTERDLADGIGPARRLVDAGAPLALGSDQHAVVDMFEDARAVEMHERLSTGQRGRFTPAELITAATTTGHTCLGWAGAGQLSIGAPADLVGVSLTSARTAGCQPDQVLYAATPTDIHTVICGGRTIVTEGHHTLGDVGTLLAEAIAPLVH